MTFSQAPNPSTQASTSETVSQQLVFIDRSVADAEQLAQAVLPGFEVILLDSNQDGIAQITAALGDRSNISGIHLIGHGASGRVRLGDTVLDQNTLSHYTDSLSQWKSALTQDADLLLYNCDVAADANGQAFVNQLSQLTEADVAASDDLTGNANLGGDWLLEYSTGLVESPLALQVQAMEAYQSVFADFNVSNAAQLKDALNQARSSFGSDRIFVTGNITLTETLPVVPNGVQIIGTGDAGATISGANGVNRVFKVSGGSDIGFSNLTLQNGFAQGANAVNGGGGGLGAGGALFIENATVEINNVKFRNNTAKGGDAIGRAGRGGNGGNLGFGGDNGAGGGAGGGFEGATGGGGGGGGRNGSVAGLDRRGEDGGNGGPGGFGQGGGGGGGAGGGQSVFFLFGALAGNGGSGGSGGNGGFGAGGGGTGGGGGGSDTTLDQSSGGGVKSVGLGGAFGGQGGQGSRGLSGGPDVDVNGGQGGQGGQGGGGAGLGAAIFARSSTVTVRNSLFEGNRVIGGTGASSGSGAGTSIFSLDSTIRLQNNQLINNTGGANFNGFGSLSRFVDIVPQVNIATTTALLTEGGTVQFNLTLDEPTPANGLTVNFQVEGSATPTGVSGADHTFQTGSFTIPGGQRSFVLSGQLIDDALPEITETLTLRLLTGSGYSLGQSAVATVQLQDNDALAIRGTAGNDTLIGTAAVEQINGGDGNDTIDGNRGNDFIFGEGGNDRIVWDSGDGDDLIDGGIGTDTLVFNCSNRGDRLIVQQAPDNSLQLRRTRPVSVDLRATNVERLEINCLNGSDGVEIRDTSAAGTTFVRVTGGRGRDVITGIGATAELELNGNAGDDALTGGKRNDQLRGGNGLDSFTFNSNRTFNPNDFGVDRIVDFVRGSDRIVLDQTTFGNITTSQIAIVDNDGLAATSAGLITYSRSTGNLFFNQNGANAGLGTGGQFATVQGNPALTANDFRVVA